MRQMDLEGRPAQGELPSQNGASKGLCVPFSLQRAVLEGKRRNHDGSALVLARVGALEVIGESDADVSAWVGASHQWVVGQPLMWFQFAYYLLAISFPLKRSSPSPS